MRQNHVQNSDSSAHRATTTVRHGARVAIKIVTKIAAVAMIVAHRAMVSVAHKVTDAHLLTTGWRLLKPRHLFPWPIWLHAPTNKNRRLPKRTSVLHKLLVPPAPLLLCNRKQLPLRLPNRYGLPVNEQVMIRAKTRNGSKS